MIMCVLLCYPVSIHMSQLLSTGRPISSFLWKKKPVRVKRETIIAPVESGGPKVPEVFAFQEAQKIALMRNLLVEDGKCLNLSTNL